MSKNSWKFHVPAKSAVEKVTPERLKVAVQVLSAFIVTPPSEQSTSPLKPAKVESAAGVPVRVTEVPMVKVSEQSAPQLIPAGVLVTVPFPVPD